MDMDERVGPGGLTRRKFLRGVGVAGTLLMLPSPGQGRRQHQRTLYDLMEHDLIPAADSAD